MKRVIVFFLPLIFTSHIDSYAMEKKKRPSIVNYFNQTSPQQAEDNNNNGGQDNNNDPLINVMRDLILCSNTKVGYAGTQLKLDSYPQHVQKEALNRSKQLYGMYLQDQKIDSNPIKTVQIRSKQRDQSPIYCMIDLEQVDNALGSTQIASSQFLPYHLMKIEQMNPSCQITNGGKAEKFSLSDLDSSLKKSVLEKIHQSIISNKLEVFRGEYEVSFSLDQQEYTCMLPLEKTQEYRLTHSLGPIREVYTQEQESKSNKVFTLAAKLREKYPKPDQLFKNCRVKHFSDVNDQLVTLADFEQHEYYYNELVTKLYNQLAQITPKKLRHADQSLSLSISYAGSQYQCTIEPTDLPKLIQLKKKIFTKDILIGDASSHLGNLVFHPNVLTNILLDSIASKYDQEQGKRSSPMSILEIGPARGIETFKMLSLGAKVTAFDLSKSDLEHLITNTHGELKDRLTVVPGKFPDQLNIRSIPGAPFDLVYMSHVAHYLTGPELRDGLEKINALLSDNGIFYFQALTPYALPYAWNMIDADEKLTQKLEWPGYFNQDYKEAKSQERGNTAVPMFGGHKMPDYGHPIHASIMKRELERQGFKVLYIGYGSLNPYISEILSPLNYREHEAYVKRLANKNRMTEKQERYIAKISKKLSELKSKKQNVWKHFLEKDALIYKENAENPNSKAEPLATMDAIFVIACKNCQQG